MSDINKAALRDRVLQHLGVLAAGETAATVDQVLVEEIIDVVHDRLRKLGYVPFVLSAIPAWAQISFRDIVAADAAVTYGMSGQRLAEFQQLAAAGERELARQTSVAKYAVPVKAEYF